MAGQRKRSAGSFLASLRKDKSVNIAAVAAALSESSSFIAQVIDGLSSADHVYRYNCLRVSVVLAEEHPQLVDQHWEKLSTMLTSPYSYQRAGAVSVLVPLACHRAYSGELLEAVRAMEGIFPAEATVNSRYILQGLGRIAAAVPPLREPITEFLLGSVTAEKPNRELLRSDVIEAFAAFADGLRDKERCIAYAANQVHSPSPRTRKASRDFLKCYGPSSAEAAGRTSAPR